MLRRYATFLKIFNSISNDRNIMTSVSNYFTLVSQDLTQLLNQPENHRMLVTIKGNVDRTKRMTTNIMRSKFHTPQPSKFISHTNNQSLNMSLCNTGQSTMLPALEPDYGIVRVDKPRYFEDAQQAISCLFHTYQL